MHKITKGLKKKKKGKKSKHKGEEELFKPEELEAYRQKHQHHIEQEQQEAAAASSAAGGAPVADNEEWKKFNALTAGIDSILKKTQDDLGRIKEDSFFQRIPPPSETKKKEQEEEHQKQLQQQQEEEEARRQRGEENAYLAEAESAIVQVSESETEEEDEDDIFDTTYLDTDIKLAYIPESPTDEQANEGDDPFDTSIAERAILGPQTERRGKKLVPLGSAVEVLTGRVQAFSCIPTKRPSSRRPHQPQDLLLAEDQILQSAESETLVVPAEKERPKSLLDDDEIPIDAPVDLTDLSLVQAVVQQTSPARKENKDPTKDILKEFDEIAQAEDEDDAEFALLAKESLSKVPAVEILPTVVTTVAPVKETWNAFGEEDNKEEEEEADPFDTTFAENILPGKAELKQIETEIFEANEDFEFNPRVDEKISKLIKSTVHISVTDPAGFRESVSSVCDRVDEEELNSLRPIHRDLLGGSNTDLSSLGDVPLTPKETEEHIDYSDPFDTSIVEKAVAPAEIELKILEKELLGEIKSESTIVVDDLEDDDFDPRREEIPKDQAKRPSRPDILVVGQSKSVAFDLTTLEPKPDLLGGGEEGSKITKPLTPYYVRENSIPEKSASDENINETVDPFDTSFANFKPGKAELALIEKELEQTVSNFEEDDFNPRAKQPSQIVKKILETTKEKPKEEIPDLLSVQEDVDAKVLTPNAEPRLETKLSYADPFDTSIATNILPGKTELKLLENELKIAEPPVTTLKRVLTDPDFNPRTSPESTAKPVNQDLLNDSTEVVSVKPLTPSVGKLSFELDEDDIDPFDTSIAANIGLGSTEIKLLESELI